MIKKENIPYTDDQSIQTIMYNENIKPCEAKKESNLLKKNDISFIKTTDEKRDQNVTKKN